MPLVTKANKKSVAVLSATIVVLAFFLALIFGYVAGSGDLVAAAIIAAGMIGCALMRRPLWMMNVILIFGLLCVGVVPLLAEGLAARSVWAISLLGLILLAISGFHAATTHGVFRQSPIFVKLAVIFVLYTLVNSMLQWSSASELLSGFKRYFQVTGLLFALAWLSIDEKTILRWKILVLIVVFFQLPWAIYQLIEWVPLRESSRYLYPGLIPLDVVAGTFGASKFSGGANAEMAAFIVIVFAFMLSRHREQLISIRRLLCFLPALIPLFLGETKVVVVLIPMIFMVLYRREFFQRPMFALGAVLVGALLTAAVAHVYLSILGKTLDEQVHDIVEYNFQDRGYGQNVLNRTTVITFWANSQGPDDPVGGVLGHGLGTAHSSTGGYLSHLFSGFGIDLTAASTLLWEQGPIGLAIFIAILIWAWREAGWIVRTPCSSDIKADACAIQAIIPIFAFYVVYRAAFLESMPIQIVFYGILGYLAWLSKAVKYG